MSEAQNIQPFVWPRGRGSIPTNYPDPKAVGFTGGKWKEIQKLVEEIGSLRDRWRKANARVLELREELRHQEEKIELERAQYARKGDQEPDDRYLKATQKEIEKAETKARALVRAAEFADADLQQLVTAEGYELAADVEQRAQDTITRYEEIMQEIQTLQGDLAVLRGFQDVLVNGKVVSQFAPIYEDGMHWRSMDEPNYIIPETLMEDSGDDAIMSPDARALLGALRQH